MDGRPKDAVKGSRPDLKGRVPMLFGPCGMSCLLCRGLLEGHCQGCVRGDRAKPDDVARHGCRVLSCASARHVAYCARDCPGFPCDNFGEGFPHCWVELRTRMAEALLEAPAPDAAAAPARRAGVPYPGRAVSLPGDGRRAPAVADPSGVKKPPKLQLFVLGRLRAVRAGRPVREHEWGQSHGPRRKVKLLLAYLVHRGRRGARRDTLIDLIWPDETDLGKAVSRFHLTLHCLRQALEPDRPPGAPSRFVRFHGSRYRFEGHGDCATDVEEFEGHCRLAAQCARAGARDRAAAEWSLAVDAYGGDYLAGMEPGCAGHPLHGWFQRRRRHLRDLYVGAVLELGSHYAERRCYAAAARLVHRVLDIQPASEAGHRLAMRCLADTGEFDAALRQYEECVAALAERMATPAIETRRLYRDILASMTPYSARR